jgi:hypothetical protein
LQSADHGEDGVNNRASDGHVGQLECAGANVTDVAGTDLDQFELQQACQLPLGRLLG